MSFRMSRALLIAQKHSPTILFGVGVVGTVGSTVLACRATMKLEDELKKIDERAKLVKAFASDTYTEKDRQRDTFIHYGRSVGSVAKLYAPSVVVGVAAIACLTKSHKILTNRNAALTAAYIALEKGFNEYRARVIAAHGADADRNFRYGSEEVSVPDTDKGGKATKTVTRVAPGEPSIYARFFDPFSSSWNKEPEYNLLFLKNQQNWANDILHSRGHLFLNEVYQMLGIPHSQAGAIVGWVMMGPNSDNFVDFGIFNGEDHNVRDFVNGREGSILLDFNVDGVIFNLIEKRDSVLPWQS